MLVVIEGLDGAGKSTQVRLMREYLEGVCPRLEYIHFPRYDAPVYGGLIGKFLRGGFGPIDGVHPQLVALLFAEDRHGAAPAIKETLASGGTVLLDRYVYSNIAYQCAKIKNPDAAEDLREWILNTEFGTFDLPRPDLNIFLDVPIGFVEASLSRARSGSDRGYLNGASDIHEADIEFQKRVRAMYLRQASLDPSLVVVDCSDGAGSMLPPEQIFNKLREVYESR
ncbi:MAG: thymidylate kinase [Bacteroidales bacterium]|nr:thymidylate kinase [Bacteroidales bacterium]